MWTMRGMKRWEGTAAAVALIVAGGFASFDAIAAKADNILVDITTTTRTDSPYFDSASIGGYEFVITNGTSSNLNKVRLEARASCALGVCTGIPAFYENNPNQPGVASCTSYVDTARSEGVLDCIVGYAGLIGKGETVRFNFGLRTPEMGGTAGYVAPDAITLHYTVRFGEGTTSGNSTLSTNPPTNDTFKPTLASLRKRDTSASVESFVPGDGLFLYTGNNNIPQEGDGGTSAVDIVPAANKILFGELVEQDTCAENPGAVYCVVVSVTDASRNRATYPVDLNQKLVIIVRLDRLHHIVQQHGTNIKAYATSNKIYHDGALVGLCPSPNKNYIPTDDKSPCLSTYKVFTKKDGAALEGDWELVFFARGNGSFGFLF